MPLSVLRQRSLESERVSFNEFVPPWVYHEHLARYQFAADYVKDRMVVDCASGNGQGTACFIEAGPKFIYAFDISESAVNEANRRHTSAPVEFQVANALHLPLESESADLFISLETIEHLEDDAAFVRETARVLKPEGLLICSTPNRALTNPGRSLNDRPLNPYHVREYTADEFNRLLGEQFSEVTLWGQNPKSASYGRILNGLAGLLPARGVARVNQLSKLLRFLYYNPAFARVTERQPRREYEYFVAVCRHPRRS